MGVDRPLRVLIVDDELLGRQRVEDLVRKEPDVEIVGMVDNGAAAVEAIRELRPDLVFLDVQMPGMTGLEVLAEIGPDEMPATIFVTAYDHYALKAFEVAAIDYLVKPFDDERFEQAFARARRMIELEEVGRATRQLLRLLGRSEDGEPDRAAGTGEGHGQPYLERLAVEMRGQVRVVPVDAIDYIEASGPYAELHVGDKTYVIRERMQTLENRLDPRHFFRIHRSAIVRLDRIETLLRSSGGDYAVRLKGGAELSVSRSRREELEEKLGIIR
ncbi:MAG TPA: LytTR family DNA-binding domain-containing protein [Longimicrobiaceae bacterium]